MKNSIGWQHNNFEVPPRFETVTWDSLVELSTDEKLIAAQYAEQFLENGKYGSLAKTSLYLSSGISGTGKTSFSICLARDLIDLGKIRTYCLFKSYMILMEELRQDGDSFLNNPAFERMKNADFVIFDDIGVDRFNRSKAERYYMVLDYFWQHMRPAIFTSKFTIRELVNRVEDDVEPQLIESIASRLVGMCKEVKLGSSKDFRTND